MSFLTAEWRKLAIANYIVDDSILMPYIPYKTELDKWNGNSYVSLVGFMFLNTKVLGMKIPFHINFEEVNLRFYIRYKENNEWKRGVVFIKELVPKKAIELIANTFYGEHYEAVRMNHNWEKSSNKQIIEYSWENRNKLHSISLETELKSKSIMEDSEEEFITEHYWGYTKINNNKTFEYEVTHPKWEHYPVLDYNIDVDYQLVYGDNFKFLNKLTPKSVMLAEGSNITVERKRKL